MPIWGYAFMYRPGTSGPPLTQNQVNRKIERLVKYVQSIQVQ